MTTSVAYEELLSYLRANRILLAPMAGVTDLAMRSLCIELGADLTYTEMVSSMALQYDSKKSLDLMRVAENEERVAVQIFGHEPAVMAKEASFIEEHLGKRLAYIDINMGCPARKIVSKGDGCALMNTPDLASKIIKEVVNACECAVTVKFRRGYYSNEETAVEFAKMAEASGAAACAVHGRYAQQLYTGRASVEAIARVKQSVCIPVIGNGDIVDAASALNMKQETACDSLMIGRAAQGNPWIFAQVKAAFDGNVCSFFPNSEERIEMALRHAELLAQTEKYNIVRMRKHAMWYVAGLPGAAKARARFNYCSSLADFQAAFLELKEQLEGEA